MCSYLISDSFFTPSNFRRYLGRVHEICHRVCGIYFWKFDVQKNRRVCYKFCDGQHFYWILRTGFACTQLKIPTYYWFDIEKLSGVIHEVLNESHPTAGFTCGQENKVLLPFLDVPELGSNSFFFWFLWTVSIIFTGLYTHLAYFCPKQKIGEFDEDFDTSKL